MTEAGFIAEHITALSYVVGALSGYSITETIKRDRRSREDVRTLSRFEVRAVAGAVALVMTAIPLVAFSELPLAQIAAHAAINGVLFPMAVGIIMTIAEKRSPGAAKMIERAAAGNVDETTIRPNDGKP